MNDVTIPIDGGSFNVWHRPSASGSPTVVLVHGLTGTSRWWTKVLPHLPADLGLIALDVRGRGQSWKAPPPYDLDTIGNDVARCLDHFDIQTAVVAGYSMGAWVATLFARGHRDRADRLILVDGGFPIEFDPGLTADEILDHVVGPAVARLSMEFESVDGYLDFWRAHPALVGRWSPLLDGALAYDLHEVGPTWRVRANVEAVVKGGSDFALDEATVSSGLETPVPTNVLVVDRGMLDQPGGFTRLNVAIAAAEVNPNIVVTPLADLNHYTLVFGAGAPHVARAIAG